jgi:hydrogenase maturation protease
VSGTAPGVLVVGLGQRERGDDGVGPAVAEALAAQRLPGVRVIEHEDPVRLLDEWAGADLVVVVDAVRSGQRPGTVRVLDANGDPMPDWTGGGGTHAFGLDAAVELARALDRLPARLVIVGVEAEQFRPGEPLSPAVAAAIGPAARAAADAIRAYRLPLTQLRARTRPA